MNSREYIIVTGGYGFIGARFVKYLIENTDFNVVIIDSKTYAANTKRVSDWFDPVKHHGRIIHHVQSISDKDLNRKVGRMFDRASFVVNFAAESHVDNSISDGSPFMETNINGTFNLLEICRKAPKLRKFVQISTDEVYGDMEAVRGSERGSNESFPLRPSSYYSASKASADLLVESCARTFGVQYLITRSCNNFGVGQDPEKFIPKMVSRLENNEPIPVYGDGQQVREWIDVDTNVEYIFKLMMRPQVNEIFNIGSGELLTNNDVIDMVEEILGRSVKKEYVKDRLGHDRKYHLNCDKLSQSSCLTDTWPQTLKDFFEFELASLQIDEYSTR